MFLPGSSSPQPEHVLSKPVIYLGRDTSRILMNLQVLLHVIWQPGFSQKGKKIKEREKDLNTIAVCPTSSPCTPLLLRD